MASSVIDEIHRRFTGQVAWAFCITQRWMSSPSCPASPQFTMPSAFCISRSMMANCFSMPLSGISLMPKRCGIIGSCVSAHGFHAWV